MGTGLLLLVTGLILAHFVESWLIGEFDRGLEAKARTFVSLTEQEDLVVELDYVEEFLPEFARDEDPEYFQMWLDESEDFARSPSLESGRSLSRDGMREARLRIRDVRLPDGRDGRQVQVEFVPLIDDGDDEEDLEECRSMGFVQASSQTGPAAEEVVGADDDAGDRDESDAGDEDDEADGEGLGENLDPTVVGAGYRSASLVIARGRDELDERILFFRLALGSVALLLMGAITLLVRWTVRAGLAPVERVSSQVEAMGADQLELRIEGDPPAELVPLVDKLNQLLGRLEAAFERERRFSSDVAHELRTPISELKSLSDVGGRWPGDRESVQEFFDDVRHISGHMDEIVGQLLALARADAGLEVAAKDAVRLRALVDEVWRGIEHDANARGMDLECEVDPELTLRSDPGKLERIVQNLLINAARYGEEGGTIGVRSRKAPGGVALSFSNPTVDLEDGDLSRLFDRFWRKDSARSSGDGAGLGLALVRAFSDLLGIAVDVKLAEDGHVTFTLTIPDAALTREDGGRRVAAG